MTVKLSSYRVTAALDPSAYVAGMAQKVAADRAGAASSKQVGDAIKATDTKVSQSGDVLTRLSRGYLDGFAQAERFTRAVHTLGRGIETGNVPMERAGHILDGIYRKFGMTADAADLAEQGHYQLASAVAALNARLAAESSALDNNSLAQQRNSAALARRRNLMFQMVDIGQGIPLLFQSPGYGLLNFSNQMAQIGQSYYGEGGMGAALRDMRGMLAGVVTRAAPFAAVLGAAAIAVSAFTTEINRGHKQQVDFTDVVVAGWELVNEAIWKALDPISTRMDEIWDETAPGIVDIGNDIVATFVAAYNIVTSGWQNLPAVFSAIGKEAYNGLLAEFEKPLLTFGDQVIIPGMDLSGAKATFSAAERGVWQGTVGDAFGKDYIRGALGTRAREVASRPSDKELQQQIKDAQRMAEAYDDLTRSAQQRIASSQLEIATLGMSRVEADRFRITQDLLNNAVNDNIKLTPRQTAELRSLGEQIAIAEDQVRQLKETYDFGKETFRSFFSDFKSDLMNSVSLWDAFANAGANALNRIADRALGMAADGIFDMIFGAVMGGLGGGGATGGSWGNGLWGSAIFNANGNAFASAGLHRYVNQVVDRPTVFPFAKGGTFGVMGEAGPEAIMPLRRGADGRLGVAANDSGVTLKVENVNMTGRSMRVESRIETRGGERVLRNLIRDEIRESSRRAAI